MPSQQATTCSINGVPFRLISAGRIIERRTANVGFERSASKSFGVARGQKGVHITAKFYVQSDLDAFESLMGNLTDQPVFFDARQRTMYTGYYVPGDIEGQDKTYSSVAVEMSFTLWEAATNMASIFDTIAAQSKPTLEGFVEYTADATTTGIPAISPRTAKITSAVSAAVRASIVSFVGESTAATDTTTDATAWTTGDKFEVVGWMTPTGFSDLSANHLMGFRIGNSTADFTKTATANSHIVVGVDSAGAIFLVAANGSAVTATSTGVTAVSGTRFKFRLTWTVGTGVTLIINDSTSLTITTNNPTQISTGHLGVGNGGTTATKIIEAHGAAWRQTPVA